MSKLKFWLHRKFCVPCWTVFLSLLIIAYVFSYFILVDPAANMSGFPTEEGPVDIHFSPEYRFPNPFGLEIFYLPMHLLDRVLRQSTWESYSITGEEGGQKENETGLGDDGTEATD